MFNRGGGDLEWRAESDEDWIGLEQFEDFVRVTLEPRSPGTNKGTVYVRDGRGAIERVPVRVEIDRRQGSKSRFWSRYKRPILAAGAFLGAVALVGSSRSPSSRMVSMGDVPSGRRWSSNGTTNS